jgi:hypothetical protein
MYVRGWVLQHHMVIMAWRAWFLEIETITSGSSTLLEEVWDRRKSAEFIQSLAQNSQQFMNNYCVPPKLFSELKPDIHNDKHKNSEKANK